MNTGINRTVFFDPDQWADVSAALRGERPLTAVVAHADAGCLILTRAGRFAFRDTRSEPVAAVVRIILDKRTNHYRFVRNPDSPIIFARMCRLCGRIPKTDEPTTQPEKPAETGSLPLLERTATP